jgi:hypothetical protein
LYIFGFIFTEEILHSTEAVWMPKDSHVLLYASFNDSQVGEMRTSWYGNINKALYPDIRSLRYPKVYEIYNYYMKNISTNLNLNTNNIHIFHKIYTNIAFNILILKGNEQNTNKK